MDDLARAARLSRQGLYLHFDTKETIFKAVIVRIVAQSRARHKAALDRDILDVPERLLGAFDAIHGSAVAEPMSEHLDELLATAASLEGPGVKELEHDFVTGVVSILSKSGVAASWKRAGISAKALAEHLYATSCGFKHSAKTQAAYRERMRTAIRIVTARHNA